MPHRIVPSLLVVLLALSACGGDEDPLLPVDDGCPEPGAPAPDLVLDDLDGVTHDLRDYRCEQVVIIDFWATWCGPCRVAMPDLQALHEEWAAQGVKVLAVNLSEPVAVVEDFMAAGGYTFTVLLGTFEGIPEGYNVWAIPRQVIIDKAGEVRYAVTGTGEAAGLNYDWILPLLLAE